MVLARLKPNQKVESSMDLIEITFIVQRELRGLKLELT